jgi:hypothetical protein
MPTTIRISGLNHAAYTLATPGSVLPLLGLHAGSLPACWLSFSRMGIEPSGSHPLGNINQFPEVSPFPKDSDLPWHEKRCVRHLIY